MRWRRSTRPRPRSARTRTSSPTRATSGVTRATGRKAEAFYHQALAIDPNHRGATEYYGELKVLEGDVAGARALLARLDSVCTFGCAEAEELRRWIDHGGDPAA